MEKRKNFLQGCQHLGLLGVSCLLISGLLLSILAESAIFFVTHGRMYARLNEIPQRRVGLVLGTSKFVSRGKINLYYRYRIDAAAALFHAGKVQILIVSGNGQDLYYNEPNMMRRDLEKKGVPGNRIYCDSGGLRTWHSMLRSQELFGVSHPIVISQSEHAARAVFLGRMQGQDAIAFVAQDVKRVSWKLRMRERVARIRALMDGLGFVLGWGSGRYGDGV